MKDSVFASLRRWSVRAVRQGEGAYIDRSSGRRRYKIQKNTMQQGATIGWRCAVVVEAQH